MAGKTGIGGSETQLKLTMDHLREYVEVIPALDNNFPKKVHTPVDVIHIFHDILFARTLRRLRFARELGSPIAFSTIFWPCFEFGGGRGDRDPVRLKKIYNLPDYWLPNSYSEYGTLVGTFEIAKPYTVVHNAVESEFPDLAEVQVPDSDILYVGRWELRKNLHQAIRAVATLDGDPKMVLIGEPDPMTYARKCKRLLDKTGIDYQILEPRTDRSFLSNLMRRARVLVQPSYFETPGLAALEAASCGTPVVVARRGSTKEYFGDHAYYCGLDPESIAQAIENALAEPGSKGPQRAKYILDRYTYDQAAKQTVEGYKKSIEIYK